jgi:hypothetical protein
MTSISGFLVQALRGSGALSLLEGSEWWFLGVQQCLRVNWGVAACLWLRDGKVLCLFN